MSPRVPLPRDEAKVRNAFERYAFFLRGYPVGVGIAVFVAARTFQSCDSTDEARMRTLEESWPLLGVYERGTTVEQMMDDWRALLAEALP